MYIYIHAHVFAAFPCCMPVLHVMSYPITPVLAILSGSPVLAVLFCQLYSACPVLPVLSAYLFCLISLFCSA
jgi:hypothetical protein